MQTETDQNAPRTGAPPANHQFVPTKAAASMLGVADQTLRANLCKHGHYMGIRPRKLPNRLLLWPVAEIKAMVEGSAA